MNRYVPPPQANGSCSVCARFDCDGECLHGRPRSFLREMLADAVAFVIMLVCLGAVIYLLGIG